MARSLEASGFGRASAVDLGAAALAKLARDGDGDGGRSGPVVDGELAIVADARIDDRAGLLAALGCDGDHDAALDDTGLILAAYRRWGDGCAARLTGDFAFAIWDARSGSLFCARDPVGVRPLFVATGEEGVAVASDMAALLRAPGVSRAFDAPTVLARLLERRYLPQHRTFHRAVRRVPPGHWLRVSARGSHLARYWFPERLAPLGPATEEAYFQALRALLEVAVRDRLPRTDGIGVHVSGGLDCGVVAVLLARMLREDQRAVPLGFSWSPPGPTTDPGDETALVDAMADTLRIEVLRCAPDIDDIVTGLCEDLGVGPDAGTLLHEKTTQRQARARGVHTIFSGWGGDQTISYSGRGLYPELLWRGRWLALARELAASGESLPRGFLRVARSVVMDTLPGRWLRGTILGAGSLVDPAFGFRTALPRIARVRHRSVREGQLSQSAAGHVAARLEDWAIAGGRVGIDYCYPLLDRRVLEFAYAAPPALFRRGRWSRWLMRKTVEPLLPASVVWNMSKSEMRRAKALDDALDVAFQRIHDDIAARPSHPGRARWVRRERMMRALSAGGSARVAKMWQLRIVLQCLVLTRSEEERGVDRPCKTDKNLVKFSNWGDE